MEISSATFNVYAFLYLFVLIPLPFFFLLLTRKAKKHNLPPGPPGWPIVGNLLQISFSKEPVQIYLQNLHQKYGPIYTIRLGSRPLIMIASADLAHQALVKKGSVFATRPPAQGLSKIFSSNQRNINSASYGPIWRTLRRNLVSETLDPAAIKSFRKGREWGMEVLIEGLKKEAAQNAGEVKLMQHLRHAVFCILLYMCFGMRLEEEVVTEVEGVERRAIASGGGFPLDEIFPIMKVFYKRRWRRMMGIRQRLAETMVKLINKRRAALAEGTAEDCRAYVDSLFSLTVEGGRRLSEGEMVTLCSEFLNGGTDSTSTTLQWVMANLVINEEEQEKVYKEIVGVVGTKKRLLEEEDVQKMAYVEAVVKETLRRHPPAKVSLMHALTEASSLGGYDIPADAWVNFSIWNMGNDPKEWEKPSEFIPERFLNAEVDMKGSREIKMMPFGVGRRICPGLWLAMLHVQFIVGRLVQRFVWERKAGQVVDLAEKQEVTVVMKNPLQAVIKERM